MLAAQEGHTSLVERLLKQHNAPIDQHAHDGKTALRYCVDDNNFTNNKINIIFKIIILN